MSQEPKSQFEEEQDKIRETKSFQRTISYLKGLADSKEFSDTIKRLRKKCHLPEGGLKEYIFVTMPANGKQVLTTPDCMAEVEYRKDLEILANKYALDFLWIEYLEHYLVYNNFEIDSFVYPIDITDINALVNGPFQYEGEEESALDYVKKTAEMHPIAILISPYASQQEIVDYIKKMHRISIKPLQDSYRDPNIKLGKTRRKDDTIKERNDFIIANKHLPSKKIVSLVAEKYGKILDYTYINKIISDYEKK